MSILSRTTLVAGTLALLGCSTAEDDVRPMAVEIAAPANVFPLVVETEVPGTSWVWSGREVTLTVTGVPSGERIFFGYTTDVTRPGPCPTALLGQCLDIGGPTLTLQGNDIADASGMASLTFTLPALPVGDIAFQAGYADGVQGYTSDRIDLPLISDRSDSDGDRAPDFIELRFGSDPTNPDTDGDGIEDADEVLTTGTNPLDPDTDGGGALDGAEIAAGTDPTDPTDDVGAVDIETVSPGDLVITEILQNPAAVADGSGEWFEIHNASGADIDLEGLVVSDPGSDTFTVTGSLVVPAGGYVVFGANDDLATNGGVAIDFAYGGFNLSNSSDEIVLSNSAGVIDEVFYLGSGDWPDPSGATMSLDPNTLDATANDDGVNWCEGSTPFGDGDLGTPGAANPACPVFVDSDGDGVFDSDELILGTDPNNADTDGDALLDGEELDLDTDPLVADTDADGLSDGEEVNIWLSNPLVSDTDADGLTDGDEVNIHNTDPLLFDTDAGGTGDGDEVLDSTDPTDPTDDISNGITSIDSLNPGDVVITEVLQNPAAVSDSVGEWFELYNASPDPIDLRGMAVADLGGESFTVMTSVVVQPGAYAVFGNDADTTINGGVVLDYAYTDFFLSNGDDEIRLSNAGGIIDEITWDGGSTWPDPTGISMSFDSTQVPDAILNDDGANWCVTAATFGDGDVGTPGAANDVCLAP